MKLRKKLFLFYLLPLLALIVISAIYAFLTEESVSRGEALISCYFKEKLLLYCPGCGGSRSLVALLKSDIISSFILYPALPITVLILFFLYIRVLLSFIKNDEKYLKGFHLNSLILIPAVIILNFLVRNILLIFFGIDIIGDIIK